MIELIHVNKHYLLSNGTHVQALADISLTIPSGEIFGVIGQSGAGKSSLIRCINLLEKPSSGKIIVDQEDLTQLTPQQLRQSRRKIGMIFQHFNLLSARTVYQNVAFPLELVGMKRDCIQKKVAFLLELTGLSERAQYYPHQLSGGQKQRVAIARALTNEPKVLLSDEATSALDPETRHSILQLLKQINATLGVTMVLITHEMQVIKETCHRLAILEQGKLTEEAAVFEFFSRPRSEVAKKLVSRQALRELPETLQTRLSPLPTSEHSPVWRISFSGESAAQPLISVLSRSYQLDINILQANIEYIDNQMLGVMLVQVNGEAENIAAGESFLSDHAVFVEVIGYLPLC